MSHKEWGDFLNATATILVEKRFTTEFPDAPRWYSYLRGQEELMDEPHYIRVPANYALDMAKAFDEWLSEIRDEDDLIELGINIDWVDIATEIVKDIFDKGGSFVWG